MGFTIETQTFGEMLKHIDWSVSGLNPKYANLSCNFSLWTVLLVYLFALVRETQLFNTLGHCVDDHVPAISWTAWYCRACNFFSFKSFIPSMFNCPSIVQKHLAQTCGSITLPDWQTFHQMSVFNCKTHNFQTR